MLGGISRSPLTITNIPTNGYIIFPNSDDNGAWYYKDWQGNIGPIGALNPVIGSSRAFGSKSTQQDSTSTSFVTYLSINVPNTSPNPIKHELLLNYIWGFSSTSQDFIGRVLIGGTPLQNLIIRHEPKDPGGDQRYPGMYFDEVTIPPGGATIEFQFASSANGTQATVYDARMRSMRVE